MLFKINHELNCLQSAFSLKIRRVLILARAFAKQQHSKKAYALVSGDSRLAARFRVPKLTQVPRVEIFENVCRFRVDGRNGGFWIR